MPEAMIARSWPRWRAHRHSFNAARRLHHDGDNQAHHEAQHQRQVPT
jgi:hypothetical protein